ncbi:hypothetical protein L1987_57333 [Smallanthus sonchifolius]|uniref:Uncharacterized protein n=1 Tax=Smallanthus sonchifolius TaxID=185202 RepID=A0ACB9DCN2_9ASTR|nr:hypothetical protein L1987_57333 [Smallanthus sonchifolius]
MRFALLDDVNSLFVNPNNYFSKIEFELYILKMKTRKLQSHSKKKTEVVVPLKAKLLRFAHVADLLLTCCYARILMLKH